MQLILKGIYKFFSIKIIQVQQTPLISLHNKISTKIKIPQKFNKTINNSTYN